MSNSNVSTNPRLLAHFATNGGAAQITTNILENHQQGTENFNLQPFTFAGGQTVMMPAQGPPQNQPSASLADSSFDSSSDDLPSRFLASTPETRSNTPGSTLGDRDTDASMSDFGTRDERAWQADQAPSGNLDVSRGARDIHRRPYDDVEQDWRAPSRARAAPAGQLLRAFAREQSVAAGLDDEQTSEMMEFATVPFLSRLDVSESTC